MGLLVLHACVLLVALIVAIHVPLHTCGPIFVAYFQGWPASGGVAVVVAGGGPRPLLQVQELNSVFPRHVRPCGELQNWAALPGGMTRSLVIGRSLGPVVGLTPL